MGISPCLARDPKRELGEGQKKKFDVMAGYQSDGSCNIGYY